MITEEFKAVIFDMDGTLVDSMPYHQDAWLMFLKNKDIHVTVEEFNTKNHGTITEIVPRFFSKKMEMREIKQLGAEKENLYRELYKPALKPIGGLIAFLDKLKSAKILVGLATAADRSNIDFTLDGLGIRHYFDVITGSEEVSKGKPDPEVFLITAEKLGVKEKDCLVVEDSITGIQSGLVAGMKVMAVSTTHSLEELISFPLYKVINDYNEL